MIKDVRLKNEINYTATKYLINHFRLKKENEAIPESVIRAIRNLFQHDEESIISEYVIFEVVTISNMKAIVIKIKLYQLKNILIKLDYT